MTGFKKWILAILLVLLFVAGAAYYYFFSSNTAFPGEKKFLYIPTGATYAQILDSIKQNNLLRNFSKFESMAQRMNLHEHIHPGRYAIEKGASNYHIIKKLRSGTQDPVKLVINKWRTNRDLIRRLDTPLEADSVQLRQVLFAPDFLQQYGLDTQQLQCLIMPNTYEVYWNSEAKTVVEKLAKYHQQFWNTKRLKQAQKLGYTKSEICTIASIVDEETLKKEDKFKIASTYLNRLKIGMPLQADPTLKFALGNFALRRILRVHTTVVSPYNTYTQRGLPPGPICSPMEETIDAVLNAPQTNYLYFCAREDFSGYSNFASNLQEHEANAKRYQQALNARGIR